MHELDATHDVGRRRVPEQEPGGAGPRARSTYSSASNVVSTITAGGDGWVRTSRVAAIPSSWACGCPSARHLDGAGPWRRALSGRRLPLRRPRSSQPRRASSGGPIARVGRRRRAGRGCSWRPWQGRAQDEVAGRVRTVAQLAAGERDALTEADQPVPAPAGAVAATPTGRRLTTSTTSCSPPVIKTSTAAARVSSGRCHLGDRLPSWFSRAEEARECVGRFA